MHNAGMYVNWHNVNRHNVSWHNEHHCTSAQFIPIIPLKLYKGGQWPPAPEEKGA
jgi:hypothetical protein